MTTAASNSGSVVAKRARLLLAGCALLWGSPGGGADTVATPDPESRLEANKALVTRLFREGFSGGNLEVVEEIFAPDIQLIDPNLPPGIEGIKAIVRKNNEAFAGWSFTLHDVLAVDDKVVVRWTGSGIHVASFMNEAPTGKRVQLNGLSIYRIAGGRIVTDWVIPDNLQFLVQLGIIPPMGMVPAEEQR